MLNVDAVGVLTSPGSHAILALGAMQAGKAVYVEKPLALTVAECEQVAEEAERTRVTAMTGFHMRFHRLVAQAREKLSQGCIAAVQRCGSSGIARVAIVTWRRGRHDARKAAAP
jgi:predicted dehydrogenase